MRWLKHAFAVEKAEDFAPTEEQKQVTDRVCRWVARRRMSTPALLFLEVSQPLNYVASQAMHFFRPAVHALLDTREYRIFAEFLEHRGSIDYLCRRIEHFEAEHEGREQDGQAANGDAPRGTGSRKGDDAADDVRADDEQDHDRR